MQNYTGLIINVCKQLWALPNLKKKKRTNERQDLKVACVRSSSVRSASRTGARVSPGHCFLSPVSCWDNWEKQWQMTHVFVLLHQGGKSGWSSQIQPGPTAAIAIIWEIQLHRKFPSISPCLSVLWLSSNDFQLDKNSRKGWKNTTIQKLI